MNLVLRTHTNMPTHAKPRSHAKIAAILVGIWQHLFGFSDTRGGPSQYTFETEALPLACGMFA
jgi:hypothetical protein